MFNTQSVLSRLQTSKTEPPLLRLNLDSLTTLRRNTLEIRADVAYTYIPGIIQGPSEPNAKQAHHRHYLRPLVDDLEKAYRRGVQCASSPAALSGQPGGEKALPRTERVAIAGIIMDLKAARPFAGLMDVNSHHFCFICNLWHLENIGRTDYRDWGQENDKYLQEGGEAWINSATTAQRRLAEEIYGTRYTELSRLPYLRLSLQLLLDVMHLIYLGLEQRFFREALGLDFSEEASSPAPVHLAHRYAFVPPPPPSALGTKQDDERDDEEDDEREDPFAMLVWRQLSEESTLLRDKRARSLLESTAAPQALGLTSLHESLAEPRPAYEGLRIEFREKIQSSRWADLAYTCNDLMLLPSDKADLADLESWTTRDISKLQMSDALASWVSLNRCLYELFDNM